MVRLIGSAQSGELLGICEPVEVSAVNHASAYLSSQTIHILCGRVGYDVGTPLEWATVDWCCKGVVDNQGHTVLVCYLGKLLDVEYSAARVCDSLSEQSLGVRTESCLNFLLACLGRYEGAVDTKFLQCYTEEVVGTAVDLVRCYEVVAALADVEDCVEVGCLTR